MKCWQSKALLLSCSLNVVFLLLFVYLFFYHLPRHFVFDFVPQVVEKKTLSAENKDFLLQLADVSFDELSHHYLKDETPVGGGYTVRELALSALVCYHHFDLKRAWGECALQEKSLYLEEYDFLLYSGIREEEWEKILSFIQEEMWPFTAKGLFLLLQDKEDDTLEETFYQTLEFQCIEVLFRRAHTPVTHALLLSLLKEGNWEILLHYVQEQKRGCDFSEDRRREFLVHYLEQGSSTAASLLLLLDSSFVKENFSDDQLIKLLDLLENKPEAELFAKEILSSSRSPTVCQRALLCLQDYTEETSQRPLRPLFRDRPPAAPSPQEHVVQPGESLWLIAKKHRVSIKDLMEANRLQSTVIRPGQVLKIPH